MHSQMSDPLPALSLSVQVKYTTTVDTTKLGLFKPEDGLDMEEGDGPSAAGKFLQHAEECWTCWPCYTLLFHASRVIPGDTCPTLMTCVQLVWPCRI
jgi:hypothetical protein